MCQLLGRPQPPGQLRPPPGSAPRPRRTGPPGPGRRPGAAAAAADRLVGVEAQGLQRPPVLGGRLLVGVQAHGPLAGPAGVGQRLGGLAGRRDLGEVVGELGDMDPGQRRTGARSPPTRRCRSVRTGIAAARRDLPDQGMGEAVAAGGASSSTTTSSSTASESPPRTLLIGSLAGGPQQRQVERLAHDRGRRQHQDGVGGQRASRRPITVRTLPTGARAAGQGPEG